MPLGMLGKYERIDVLGHGVSGIVYLARDTMLNRQVALKEVDVQSGDLNRFLEEARVMDRLRHPNIVRVNNVDRIEGHIVIDMEYVRGANLQQVLRAEGPLPLDRALDIMGQVLSALDYAHGMQTVHRDIKPANILVGRDGEVKLGDFGLAEILSTNAYAGGAGTYAYMAPEDFAAEDRSDHQSDLWAVGVTLFEILTGERPFQATPARDPFAWKRALETEDPEPVVTYLPDAPAALQTILSRALAREKRDRYATASEFRADLLCLLEGEPFQTSQIRKAGRRHVTAENRDGHIVEWDETKTQAQTGEKRQQVTPLPATSFLPPRVSQQRDAAQDFRSDHQNPPMGEVVADLSAELKPASGWGERLRLPFSSRKIAPRLVVEPDGVDFGTVRKGELRTVRLQVRSVGLAGPAHGRVQHTPGWLTIHPTQFDRPRQTLTLTAHTARAWETGEFAEQVIIETGAGSMEIPVHISVMKPRPTFAEVVLWFLPLFAITLLPVLAVSLASHAGSTGTTAALAPPAIVGSGLLATMLLLISIAADIGYAERFACALVMMVMFFLMGMSAAAPHATGASSHIATLFRSGLNNAGLTGGVLGCVLILQLLHLRRWKLWGGVLACLGLLFGGILLRGILHG